MLKPSTYQTIISNNFKVTHDVLGNPIPTKMIGAMAGIASAFVMILTGEQKEATRNVRINIIRATDIGKYCITVNISNK